MDMLIICEVWMVISSSLILLERSRLSPCHLESHARMLSHLAAIAFREPLTVISDNISNILCSGGCKNRLQSDHNGPREKVLPPLFVPREAVHFRPLYGSLWPSRTGFPSGQARRVHRTAQSRTKCSKLKCRIPALWSARQEA